MKLLLLDPGLSTRSGHNAATLEEVAAHALASGTIELTCASAISLDPANFGGIACTWRPVFRLHGYSRFLNDSDSHEALLRRLTALCMEDLRQLDLAGYDLVLMPTAYPIHLAALSMCVQQLPALRLRVGLLMPPTFWACDAQAAAWLEQLTHGAIDALRAQPGVWLYSETGHYGAGAATVPTATLLPPIAAGTRDWLLDQLARQQALDDRPADRPVVFGYFGDPSTRKGFELLMHCVQNGLPAGMRLSFILPEGHHALAARLDGCGTAVSARTLGAGNIPYLKAMRDVDVVLAFYDPAVYRRQMSGIVADALCLGKPVLTAEGCEAILAFGTREAAGALHCRPADADGLLQGLGTPWTAWRAHRRAALASAHRVLELKRMERHLDTGDREA
ncbi:MAG: hypothetical protein EOP76_15025 [Variovorax sp.]|nr:MAG: hypothetical protein EOP76_15025 [Variovorax sp.]